MFDAKDFDAVSSIIAGYSGVLFSPHVLSETSNLIRYSTGRIETEVSSVFSQMIRNSEERYVAGRSASERGEFGRFGLTDAVLMIQAASGATLLTVDLDQYLAACRVGYDAINYNHIKNNRDDYR